ncbi:MAG TPA: NAD-dependent epimerase/dehydratase family protein [Burkholderiaceae bacterium]|nr:NAD-dependent epimerase/dehydratase family protein [Burkholderiaceae bacterium]
MKTLNVVVTGGCGFLGQALLRALAARRSLAGADGTAQPIGRILALDLVHHPALFTDPLVEYVRGDAGSAVLLPHVLGGDTASVFHLAAVEPQLAETDFDLGMRTHVDGMRALLEACRAQRRPPRFVFASSLAVLGPRPDVDDDTRPAPSSSFGIQKQVGELLAAQYGRQGFVDARTVRLGSVVPRGEGPADAPAHAHADAYADPARVASQVARAARAAHRVAVPFPLDAAFVAVSLPVAIASLIHAHDVDATTWRDVAAVNLPGQSLSIGAVLVALARATGRDARALVDAAADGHVAASPRSVVAARAARLGFPVDGPDIASIVAHA